MEDTTEKLKLVQAYPIKQIMYAEKVEDLIFEKGHFPAKINTH